jgi:dihydrofolate synthase/folylpolyglutamate synthase
VSVADALLDSLAAAGIAWVGADQRRAGYANARWPGRLELLDVDRTTRARTNRSAGAGSVQERVEVLLDGAHNPAGAAALARALDDLRPLLAGGRANPPVPLTLVVGIMADKDVEGVIGAMAHGALGNAQVICTQVGVPRALPAVALAAALRARRPGTRPIVERDPIDALDRALGSAPGPIVVAGSLYLVGLVRSVLAPDPALTGPLPQHPVQARRPAPMAALG